MARLCSLLSVFDYRANLTTGGVRDSTWQLADDRYEEEEKDRWRSGAGQDGWGGEVGWGKGQRW